MDHSIFLLAAVAVCLAAAQDLAYYQPGQPVLEVRAPLAYPGVAVDEGYLAPVGAGGFGRYLDDRRRVADSAGRQSFSSGSSGASGGSHLDEDHSGRASGGYRSREGEAAREDESRRLGHRTSGFRSSYHKDESALDTSFFDDGRDEGSRGGEAAREGYFDESGARGGSGGRHQAALEGSRGVGKALDSFSGAQARLDGESFHHDVKHAPRYLEPHHDHLHY